MIQRRIFVVGATGAQGIPVCRGLVEDNGYSLRILTRDPKSSRAQSIAALGDVDVIQGSFADETALRKGFEGCWGAFINIDGFNCGEKTETFWTIRAYELALEAGIKFFVFGNLDYAFKKGGYKPQFRVGHYDAKGRLAEWMLQQRKENDMGLAIFTTGPYLDMAISASTFFTPRMEDGVVTWKLPLGDGAMAHVDLDDCAYYVRWLFDHPERSDGMNLEVAIEHVKYADLAKAFEQVTGKPAAYQDVPAEVFFRDLPGSDNPAGYNSDASDPATMSIKENFSGFFNMWKVSGGDDPVIKRDYNLLDEIHPNRIRSAEQFLRKADAKLRVNGGGGLYESISKNGMAHVLKLSEDNRQGGL
ncbi:hypothetical protein FHETE_2033 [Fusarium heterosporum]|uniref:NmrA-like domain-containing protein n=1 Tax=Fusarium heterosporum TaxID=42747 RepID=A0A8H5TYC9_FUSHE|nr:hypothetical protein FHETE_2033 [Fusarium heterosporum]